MTAEVSAILKCIRMHTPTRMERSEDTSIRISKVTKKRFRQVVKDRGMPESISDDDAIATICGWVESLLPSKEIGA